MCTALFCLRTTHSRNKKKKVFFFVFCFVVWFECRCRRHRQWFAHEGFPISSLKSNSAWCADEIIIIPFNEIYQIHFNGEISTCIVSRWLDGYFVFFFVDTHIFMWAFGVWATSSSCLHAGGWRSNGTRHAALTGQRLKKPKILGTDNNNNTNNNNKKREEHNELLFISIQEL